MKYHKIKHGGLRAGAGRPHKWQGGETKLVRIPVAYVDKILRVVAYMDAIDTLRAKATEILLTE